MLVFLLLLLPPVHLLVLDTNILTGANDVVAVTGRDGLIRASPFSVQLGKKYILLPRTRHVLTLAVNGRDRVVQIAILPLKSNQIKFI